MDGIAELLSDFDWTTLWLLPNTAGCQKAEDAIRLAFIGREIAKNLHYNDNRFVKIEILNLGISLIHNIFFTFARMLKWRNW